MFWNYFKVRKYYMYFQLKPKSNLRLHIFFRYESSSDKLILSDFYTFYMFTLFFS